MGMIYHMLPADEWAGQDPTTDYAAESLAMEGFIHCTGELENLPQVANRFYRTAPGDFVLLVIDEERVIADVKWEPADGHHFPHIYGALNQDAIVDIRPFPRDRQGVFLPVLPARASDPLTLPDDDLTR